MTMMEFRAVTRVIRQFPACPLRPMPAATLDNDEEDYAMMIMIIVILALIMMVTMMNDDAQRDD